MTDPRLVAVLVVHNGLRWLPVLFATLSRWRYSDLQLVVIDNASTDGSGRLLAERIPHDNLITLDRAVGFGRAVAAARRHPAVAAADLMLLLHDDLVLAPDAVAAMVEALRADEQLAVVGPKLREWTSDPLLQQVGMTVDRFGRAESRLEPDELDQGQHDDRRDVLYVSTAGMMVRNTVFEELGGFDPRFSFMRDDLDLCWRMWLRGYRVEVVPQAVGYHISAATRGGRPVGRGRPWEARYLAERHGLAAMISNYALPQLLWTVPVTVLLTVAKVLGFLATRRFGAAAATVRAYAWNLVFLPLTLRQRRVIQRDRVRSDRELRLLFATGLPRLRGYAEAMGGWIGHSDTQALLDEGEPVAIEQAGTTSDRSLWQAMRRHPVATAGVLLLMVYTVGLLPLLGSGQLVGGQVLPWPEQPWEFLRAYVSRWNGEPVASPAFASPIQAVLGFASFLGFGSAWAAQRLLVLGLLPLAWLGAVRAGRAITIRPVPRVLGATVYVVSPAVVNAMAEGRYGALVLAAVLPTLVALTIRATRRTSTPSDAWRAAAFLALLLMIALAAAPSRWLVPAGILLAAMVVAARPGPGRAPALVRLLTCAGLALAMLAPWLWDLMRTPDTAVDVEQRTALPAWQALLGVPGFSVTAGALTMAGMTLGIVIAAIAFGLTLRARLVLPLLAGAVGWSVLAWAASRIDAAPGIGLLLPASLAIAGLAVVAARTLLDSLRAAAFGRQQLIAVVTAAMIAGGVVTGVARMASSPWDQLTVAPELVPLFVGADAQQVGPYRILLLAGDGVSITWQVTDADGPSMVSYGTVDNPVTLDALEEAVVELANDDARSAVRLGASGVRFLVVQTTPGAETLADMIERQPGLEPVPSGAGRVFRVRSWLPRAAVLTGEQAGQVLSGSAELATESVNRLEPRRPDLYAGRAAEPGLVTLTEPASGVWQAVGDGRPLERADLPDAWQPLTAFELEEPGPVRLEVSGRARHLAAVTLQALVALATLSLALRPPSFVDDRGRGRRDGGLPAGMTTPGADETRPPATVKERA